MAYVFLFGFGPEVKNSDPAQISDQLPVVQVPHASKLALGTVVRVIDGDTLIIDAHDTVLRYQILGADAPEFTPKSRNLNSFAQESNRFLEQLILGEQVYIQYDPLGKRDGSKRWTAYLFRAPDMLFVNLELVRQGYAKHNPKQVSLHHEAFVFYESKAKELKRGIWNPDLPELNRLDFEPEPEVDATPEAEPETKTEPQRVVKNPKPDREAANPVHTTKYGKKYHRKGCPHITKGSEPIEREKLDESLTPCKTCRPDGQ